MKVIRPIIILIVLLIVFGGGYLIQRQKDEHRSVLSGTFESQPALLSARVGGRVKRLIVEEGDSVKAGQLLAVLDAKPDVLDTASLEAQVKAADQDYREAVLSQQEQTTEQEATVQELRAALDKEINGSRPDEIHAGRAALAEAQQKYAEALNGSRPQEIGEARAAYQASVANLAKVRRGGTPAERAKARADLDAAKATERETKLASDRRQWLFEEGAISQEARDDALADYQVAVGKRQSAEQSLADLDSRPEDIAVAEREATQNLEHLRLLQAGSRDEEIGAAKAARDQAAANLRLLVIGSRQEDIDQARAKLDNALETLRALRDGSRNNVVKEARMKLDQAIATEKSAMSKTSEQEIRAPEAGIVDRKLVAEGELLSAGTALYRVEYPTDLYLRIYVPEQELAHVHVGDGAVVDVDGVPGPVDCRVDSVSTGGEFTPANLQTPEERGKQVFSVRLKPYRANPWPKAGMSATVRSIGDWKP